MQSKIKSLISKYADMQKSLRESMRTISEQEELDLCEQEILTLEYVINDLQELLNG